ncbi:four helix bundle protein [Candidatus Collierbacteria bacterium]|nr:four helix bundle protein [Candidatus Collierbacteria bacterium]
MTQDTNQKNFNLEERTAKFGEKIILFCKDLNQDTISKPLISQLVRSATSVGANYMEANGASSKTDFRNKIYICKKESQETKHWLRMLSSYFPEKKDQLRLLWGEVQELTLIFQKITNTLSNKGLKLEN